MRALLDGKVDLAALPLTNIAQITGVHAVAICPLEFNLHIAFTLCINPAATSAASHLANWLTSSALNVRLLELGAQRVVLIRETTAKEFP